MLNDFKDFSNWNPPWFPSKQFSTSTRLEGAKEQVHLSSLDGYKRARKRTLWDQSGSRKRTGKDKIGKSQFRIINFSQLVNGGCWREACEPTLRCLWRFQARLFQVATHWPCWTAANMPTCASGSAPVLPSESLLFRILYENDKVENVTQSINWGIWQNEDVQLVVW